jgi:hypothetical protein
MNRQRFEPRPPDGQIERGAATARRPAAASYAPLVPRLRRRLPAAASERRARARLDGQPWRGRLIDLQR